MGTREKISPKDHRKALIEPTKRFINGFTVAKKINDRSKTIKYLRLKGVNVIDNKSYSNVRTKEFVKSFTVYKLKYEKRGIDPSLFKEVKSLNIRKNNDFSLYNADTNDIRINIRDYIEDTDTLYIFASFYHPKAAISVTPKEQTESSNADDIKPIKISIENITPISEGDIERKEEPDDLQHIERYDEAHLFLAVRGNEISAGITIAHPNSILNRISQLLARLGLRLDDDENLISHIVDKSVVRQIQKRGFYGIGVTTKISTTSDPILKESTKSIFRLNKTPDLQPIAGATMKQADIVFTKKEHLEIREMTNDDIAALEPELNEFFYLLDRNKTKIYPREFVVNMQYYCKPYGLSTIFPSTAQEILLDNIKNQT